MRKEQLYQLAEVTETFSIDICMEFGIDKCKINSVKNGLIDQHNYTLQTGQTIDSLEETEYYRYLGYNQSRQIHYKETKSNLMQKFKHRLNSIMKTQLNSKNIVKAVNTYAVTILTYSFGIIKWSKSELQALQRLINTTMSKHRKHHPKSCLQRLTLPRNDGGRGFMDVINLHNKQIQNLRYYFHCKAEQSNLHKAIVHNDLNLTPLNLKDKSIQNNVKLTDRQTRKDEWALKSLHGRHYHDLSHSHVDRNASNEWLHRGELFPETEGFMSAIQDQVIETRNYQKYIMKIRNVVDVCRRCNIDLINIVVVVQL